ncbi:NADH:flavin oxidoreductase [Bacillus paralicheniformis]|uniref:NADH:flavin oxidoreductase n=1 Tax=Bacillus paralicheniformis TaxID=1648923 RepID=UPI000D03D9C2|nr:NADH:flavin oxidoreductase [Bacillus paralicheniformis]
MTNKPSIEALFEPFNIGALKLNNRIAMAPMTRTFSPNGIPGEDVEAYYRRRAENEVGLIITEGTVINHPASASNPSVPRFYGEEALKGWKRVVQSVHKAGGRIIPQLWHVGTQRAVGQEPNPEALPIGPSGITADGLKVNEPMTQDEIDRVVHSFAKAAEDAQKIGFDGIELHGGHGYLIDQFFWKQTNCRIDQYAGGIAERTRFAAEIVKACRHAVGPDFPIILRFSQWKRRPFTAKLVYTPDELDQFLSPLVDAGVDVFHCSTRRFWEPEFENSSLSLAGWTKKLSGKPVITVGSVGLDNEFLSFFAEGKGAQNVNIDGLIQRLENKEFDLVAVGRALLVDPKWAVKIRDGRIDELIPFSPEASKVLY